MNLGHPDRRDRLDLVAGEYVLGTLPARARARLRRASATDPAVARAIAEWERRLCGLGEATPAVAPPPGVWDAIVRRLDLGNGSDTREQGWWTRVAFWRTLAIASFAGVIALGVTNFVNRYQAAGTIVVVLAGADAKPALVATASRDRRELRVKAIGAITVPPDRSLELWKLPAQGAPQSMGLVNANGTVTLPLREEIGKYLAGAKGLAITLEPAGGSPTGKATGPILYTGKIETI